MSKTYLTGLREKDQVLTNLALGYKQGAFIGEQVMPVVMTDKEGLKVPKYGKGSFVEYTTERAVGAASNIITLDSHDYLPVVLEEHDLAAGVDYRVQHESLFDEQAKAARRVTAGVQLRQEIEIARLVRGAFSLVPAHARVARAASAVAAARDRRIAVEARRELHAVETRLRCTQGEGRGREDVRTAIRRSI